MTKSALKLTLTRNGKTMGRPRKHPPPDAARRIEDLAANGHSLLGVAVALRTCRDVFARWLEEAPELREAFERGRERERFALHNKLFQDAMNGNTVAALFLLKSRHGYREGDQSDAGNRVSINFTLPGALTREAFTIEHEPNSNAEPLSGARTSRT